MSVFKRNPDQVSLNENIFTNGRGIQEKTRGAHEDLCVSAHLGVCIHANFSGRPRFEHALKKDDYMDQTESPSLNEGVNSLWVSG